MTKLILLGVAIASFTFTACDRGRDPAAGQADAAADANVAGIADRGPALDEGWQEPGAGWVNVRRQRAYDLTSDGAAEEILVTAEGASYDSLTVTLVIRTAARDTLWLHSWPSLLYFQYDPLAGKADTTVARIVRAHVDSLVHESRFSESGLPSMLRRGSAGATMNESVQFHLAEIDFRGQANLEARDPTPAGSWDRINEANVVPERVRAVRDELERGPTFMYYAGGEASYVLGWSPREQSFVRLFSCC
jgi:hypothetical protein